MVFLVNAPSAARDSAVRREACDVSFNCARSACADGVPHDGEAWALILGEQVVVWLGRLDVVSICKLLKERKVTMTQNQWVTTTLTTDGDAQAVVEI